VSHCQDPVDQHAVLLGRRQEPWRCPAPALIVQAL